MWSFKSQWWSLKCVTTQAMIYSVYELVIEDKTIDDCSSSRVYEHGIWRVFIFLRTNCSGESGWQDRCDIC